MATPERPSRNQTRRQPMTTLAEVFRACDELESLSNGQRWGNQEVRKLLGGGSYEQISPLIKLWRSQKDARLRAPSAPSTLVNAVLEAVDKAFASHNKAFDQALGDVRNEAGATTEELLALIAERDVELEQLQQERGLLQEAASRNQKELDDTGSALNTTRQELQLALGRQREQHLVIERLQADNAALGAEVREMRAALLSKAEQHATDMASMTDKHQSALDGLRDQHAKAVDSLANKARQDDERHKAEKEELMAAFKVDRESWANKQADLEGNLVELRLSLQASQKRADDYQRSNQHARQRISELEASRDEQAVEYRELVKENQDLKVKLARAEGMLELLQAGSDDQEPEG